MTAQSRVLWISLLALSIFDPGARAQEDLMGVHGTIRDRKTAEPLPYANIYVKGKSIGVVSNDAGEFGFKVPAMLKGDTLVISYVGYVNFESVLSLIRTDEFLLTPTVTQLQEILVKDVDAAGVVRKAMNNIINNYPITPYIMKGFYRDWKKVESIFPDSSGVHLLEAAVTLYDKGYGARKTKSLREEVFLDEIRRTKSSGHIYNYLHFLLLQNFVSYPHSKNIGSIYSPFDFEHLIDYRIADIVTQGLENIYVIAATLPDSLGRYELHISAEDFSFLRISFKAEMARDVVLGEDPEPKLKRTHQLTFVDNTLVFRRYQGRVYLSYLKLNWRVRTQLDDSKKITSEREFWQELLINDIITADVSQQKEKLKFPMRSSQSLESQTRPYNETFWKNFNVVKERPLDTELMKLLEKEERIEKQFMQQRPDTVLDKGSKPKKAVRRSNAKV